MKYSVFSSLLYWVLRFIVSLRYRIHVCGLKEIVQNLVKEKGLLILPNHVAEIDPVILFVILWPYFRPRPIVVEDFYYLQGIQVFLKFVKALPCPNMEHTVNRWKIRRLEKLQNQIVEGLKVGEKYLIYPSGKLKIGAQEVLGGASFVPSILSLAGDAESSFSVVLVRSEGLWGSRFSRALTGQVPHFAAKILESLKVLLKNFVLFTPRRVVRLTFELAPSSFFERKERQSVNRYLENWYNAPHQGKGDDLVLVSDSFWRKKYPKIQSEQKKKSAEADLSLLSEENKRKILEKIADLSSVSPDQVNASQKLIQDLGLDSLDIAQLAVFLDDRFHRKDLSPSDLETVEDTFRFAISDLFKKEPDQSPRASQFPQEKKRPHPCPPEGNTIQEAFLRSCDRMGSYVACVDALSGALTYKRLKMMAFILAEKIEELPGNSIGILLPSSVGAYLAILAVLLAKKTPVMLNWTAGVKALDHAVKTAKVEVVLSSLKFLSRLRDLELGMVEDRIFLLEDLKRSLGLKDKIKGLQKAFTRADKLMKKMGFSNLQPEDPAVILFTSGTETTPKGVPLSHKNLLSNQKAAIEVTPLTREDLLYGVLPPFHSFGFSITGLLPLLSGLKVLYAPDPTDAHAMARDIAAYGVTFFVCAPSFLLGLFLVAEPMQLKSLRLVVSGAEKMPKELCEHVEGLGPSVQLIEGYGITECGPIVTMNRANEKKRGVGHPLEGVELKILHPESDEILPQGQQGEICIHGPNVFKGYLEKTQDPFLVLEQKKWYRSGDLGSIDPSGFLLLSGRLKRFVKIGGEMVSLGGLEEEILQILKEKHLECLPSDVPELKGPPIALCAIEKAGEKTLLILLSVYKLEKELINICLKQRGYSNLIRISEIRQLKEIPLTGTGKTQYRSLEQSL